MKHWTTFLPEGVRIFMRERRMLLNRVSRVELLRIELQNAEKECEEFEESILKDAKKQYTQEEIELAKEQANSI